jgi:AraC family transcriptional regulator of adaptative response/methylated-DNA-[protein]-cysteine methyltransferase
LIAIGEIATPLGTMVAAWGPRGLALLEFADRFASERNLRHLKRRFPDWDGHPAHELPGRLAGQLDRYFAGRLPQGFDLELDAGGTPFQRTVWCALRQIPSGSTESYEGVARAIDAPGKCRAVARANGANPLAIVVPCHRVIGADGSLTGYGGGLWRKQWLLAFERRSVSAGC